MKFYVYCSDEHIVDDKSFCLLGEFNDEKSARKFFTKVNNLNDCEEVAENGTILGEENKTTIELWSEDDLIISKKIEGIDENC